ncbi:MAG: hypothetical protein ACKVQW_14560 [Pyrinomonadaceae bacterium]
MNRNMTNEYSMEDLLDFLGHAGERGLMPAATAQALSVATRNVFGVLEDHEQKKISELDIGAVIKRFNNKRAKDFNTASLKEYGRRVKRAIELYEHWKDDPAKFSVKTRAARNTGKKSQAEAIRPEPSLSKAEVHTITNHEDTYQSSCPVGPGRVITLINVPKDLTSVEAKKLAEFVNMLAVN